MSGMVVFSRSKSHSAPSLVTALSLCAVVMTAGCVTETTGRPASEDATDEGPAGAEGAAAGGGDGRRVEPLCDEAEPGFARCFAQLLVAPDAASSATNIGLTPEQVQVAYQLSPHGGTGRVVAIVDAFDDPNAEADLSVYRAHFGLPPCTTANGCFKKVNQRGKAGSYPKPDAGWAGEISLDLDAVSAACPQCSILLVETDSNKAENLAAGVATAAHLGAAAISNSYGMVESATLAKWYGKLAKSYRHRGVAVVASAGDGGYGVAFPAAVPEVIAVGGTSLVRDFDTDRGWSETVWGAAGSKSGTGSGCSAVFAKPAYQKDTGCAKRSVADISAVADPYTGLAVFDTFVGPGGVPGWQQIGGTSLSAPLVAASMVSAGVAGDGPGFFYAHANTLNDVVAGANGTCSPGYLCAARAGYDGPTGLGTPDVADWGFRDGSFCHTTTLDKDVDQDTCVQSKYDEQWYQCDRGVWESRWQDTAPCSSTWPLGPEGCKGAHCPQ